MIIGANAEERHPGDRGGSQASPRVASAHPSLERVGEAFGLVRLADKLTRRGEHNYRTRAYDRVGHRSEWSEPVVVVMPGRGP